MNLPIFEGTSVIFQGVIIPCTESVTKERTRYDFYECLKSQCPELVATGGYQNSCHVWRTNGIFLVKHLEILCEFLLEKDRLVPISRDNSVPEMRFRCYDQERKCHPRGVRYPLKNIEVFNMRKKSTKRRNCSWDSAKNAESRKPEKRVTHTWLRFQVSQRAKGSGVQLICKSRGHWRSLQEEVCRKCRGHVVFAVRGKWGVGRSNWKDLLPFFLNPYDVIIYSTNSEVDTWASCL